MKGRGITCAIFFYSSRCRSWLKASVYFTVARYEVRNLGPEDHGYFLSTFFYLKG